MPPVAKKRSSQVVVPEMPKWPQRLAALLIYILIRAISLTMRVRYVDRAGLKEGKLRAAAIYCVWHNRLALSMPAYFNYIKRHNDSAGLVALMSASRDGSLLMAVIGKFGVKPVRGSTSRRGPQALRELTTWAKRGYDLAITPDGPRGPKYVMQEGIVALAQLTGMMIVPVAINVKWKISVKSWDGFQIPLPFSCCEMIYGEPTEVPRETPEADREKLRQRVENILREISVD
jgi:hypothetical protein